MLRKDILPFNGEYIDVGTPHYGIDNRLFFQKGILEEILDDCIKLKFKNGIKIIPFNQILEIRRLR